jgi:hypothetical protein
MILIRMHPTSHKEENTNYETIFGTDHNCLVLINCQYFCTSSSFIYDPKVDRYVFLIIRMHPTSHKEENTNYRKLRNDGTYSINCTPIPILRSRTVRRPGMGATYHGMLMAALSWVAL